MVPRRHEADGERFVFAGQKPDRPLSADIISKRFNAQLAVIGIDDKTRMARGLVFHGLRHKFAKEMNLRLETKQAMKATGHLTPAMLDHYADHMEEKDFTQIAAAASQAFGTILPFTKEA